MPHRRTYETAAIRVQWDSARCIHTGICLTRLPEVFDVQARPWVDLDGLTRTPLARRSPAARPALCASSVLTTLCRCGLSRNQPFCDGSHADSEFKTREANVERDRLEAETPAAFTPNPRVPDPREL